MTKLINRRSALWLTAAAVSFPSSALSAAPAMTVHKDPSCGCCGAWIDHVRAAGFAARVVEEREINRIKGRFSVPKDLWACHTAEISGYVIEGHVPAEAITALLGAKPPIKGLAVPGMPVGSPGMEVSGVDLEVYDVIAFGSAKPRVFMKFKGQSRVTG